MSDSEPVVTGRNSFTRPFMPFFVGRAVPVVSRVLRAKKNAKEQHQEMVLKLDQSERLRGLLHRVRSRIHTRKAYAKLLALICFFVMYVWALLMQQRVEDSFAIESRYHFSFRYARTRSRI
jgi:hypothetical protein